MASASLYTPPSCREKIISFVHQKPSITSTKISIPNSGSITSATGRREFVALVAGIFTPALILPAYPAVASSDEEYVKDTREMINMIRNTITMDRNDPNVAQAVSDLRENSDTWVAKYRREKSLLGRSSFRDIYSALNAVSGHYVSFGPTAPIPAKRKSRILEEVDTAEKSLIRGR